MTRTEKGVLVAIAVMAIFTITTGTIAVRGILELSAEASAHEGGIKGALTDIWEGKDTDARDR